MKKQFFFLLTASFLTLPLLGFSCSGSGTNRVVATVNGTSITDQELTEAASDQLKSVEMEIYKIKRRVLDNLIEQKLIEAAAKKEGGSAGEYLEAEVTKTFRSPTEEEAKNLYNAQKDRFEKSFDEMKGEILAYLTEARKRQVEFSVMNRIRENAEIQVKLEPPRVEVDIAGAPSIGPENAKVTIVEFSDYECPFCRRVRPAIQQILGEYEGKVKYVFRDFPLSFHRNAKKAHEAAYCAGEQGKYFEYNEALFGDQKKLGVEDLKKHAAELQLNTDEFHQCLESGKHTARVEQGLIDGQNYGVSGTPAFFINGIMLSGAQPYAAFKEIIDAELKR